MSDTTKGRIHPLDSQNKLTRRLFLVFVAIPVVFVVVVLIEIGEVNGYFFRDIACAFRDWWHYFKDRVIYICGIMSKLTTMWSVPGTPESRRLR